MRKRTIGTPSTPVPHCTLELKIIPNAPRNEVVGWLGTALKVKIHAPALEGRANDALLDFLAALLGVPRRDVSLLRGDKSRQKIVRIEGLDAVALRHRLDRESGNGRQ
jgi:uncharacterized protein (TIGR00251 family)